MPMTPLTPLEPWIAARIGQPGRPMDRQLLHRFQRDRLRRTVQLVRSRAPYYRRRLAGLPPGPATREEFTNYPFTTAADLAAHGRRMLCVGQDEISRVVTADPLGFLDTSGTTGPPKRLWFTAADLELTIDFFRVGMSTFTGPGDRVLILLPAERPGGVGDLLAAALRRLGAEPVRHGVVDDLDATVDVLHRNRVDVAVGIPVQVLALARRDPTARLRAVLLSTDHVPTALARTVEDAWGCTVYNHYGMTETGLGGGVECRARRGYHLREADLLVEIVDPATAAPVPDGVTAEIVISTLTRTGMPLLRYRTGDLGRFLPGPCPCGTTLRTLERVTRRVAGVHTTAAGAPLALADLDEAVFARPGVVDVTATLVRTRAGDRLDVTVHTVPARPAAAPGRSGGPPPDATAPGSAEPSPQALRQTLREALQAIPALAGDPATAPHLRIRVRPGTAAPAPAKRRMKVVDSDA
jgi:phenylacetate-CoA ligase